jgi:hypothetical protein
MPSGQKPSIARSRAFNATIGFAVAFVIIGAAMFEDMKPPHRPLAFATTQGALLHPHRAFGACGSRHACACWPKGRCGR